MIGLNRISIVAAESGRSTNITRLYEIAEALNVSIDDLFPSLTWYIESKDKRAVKKITVELI
jgi:DNA-binding XRE family transcriptional regulator